MFERVIFFLRGEQDRRNSPAIKTKIFFEPNRREFSPDYSLFYL